MPVKGNVTLCDKEGNAVTSREYDGHRGRNIIFEQWKKFYGAKYNSCYIQYAPVVNILAIAVDGSNTRKKPVQNRVNGKYISVKTKKPKNGRGR
jgi:hypothetical protein